MWIIEQIRFYFTERRAVNLARQMNRDIAHSEWRQGRTEKAMIHMDVSDIRSSEILQFVDSLERAAGLLDRWDKENIVANNPSIPGMYSVCDAQPDDEVYEKRLELERQLEDITGLPKGRIGDKGPSIESYRGLMQKMTRLAATRR